MRRNNKTFIVSVSVRTALKMIDSVSATINYIIISEMTIGIEGIEKCQEFYSSWDDRTRLTYRTTLQTAYRLKLRWIWLLDPLQESEWIRFIDPLLALSCTI